MRSFILGIFLFTLLFDNVYVVVQPDFEQIQFEKRVKTAPTIIFGRFNWFSPSNQFQFFVYCTIKENGELNEIRHEISIRIEDLESEIEMRKNRWFVLFPEPTSEENLWSIKNRSSAFDLYDDLKLEIFERFCFLKPKIPFGFPLRGLLNRCPKASPEFCLKNGTRIEHDELFELKNFLTSTKKTTRKTPKRREKLFIEPIW